MNYYSQNHFVEALRFHSRFSVHLFWGRYMAGVHCPPIRAAVELTFDSSFTTCLHLVAFCKLFTDRLGEVEYKYDNDVLEFSFQLGQMLPYRRSRCLPCSF